MACARRRPRTFTTWNTPRQWPRSGRRVAADPRAAAASRVRATSFWLSTTFTRGNMTVDDYLGRVTKPNPAFAPPPPDTVAPFRDAIEKAMAIARRRLAENPKDA